MTAPDDEIRHAEPADYDAVDGLLRAAFGQPDEAELVCRLRAEGEMAGEHVGLLAGELATYAGLSRMRAPQGWLCLAPVATLPRLQRRGLAIRHLRQLTTGTQATIVVLGEPGLYQRAGFSTERARRLTSPYPIAYTAIARPGDDVPEATLVYPRAFG